MKVGIVCTLRVESGVVLDKLFESNWAVNTSFYCKHMAFYTGYIGKLEVVLGWCLSGKVSTALCTQALLSHYGVDLIFSVGTASALTSRFSVGDLFLASSVVQFDVDTSAVGNPLGWVSGLDCVDFFLDYNWVCELQCFAQKWGIPIEHGTLVSGDRFLSDGKSRRCVRNQFSASVADMDAAGVVQSCVMLGKPCLVLRTVTDHGDGFEYIENHTPAVVPMFKLVLQFLSSLGLNGHGAGSFALSG